MNKFVVCLLSIIACSLLLGGFMVILLSIINAVTYASSYLFYILVSLPLFTCGILLYKWIDRQIDAA